MNFSDKLFISNLITSAANKQRKIARMTRQRKKMQMAARKLRYMAGGVEWWVICQKCYRLDHEGECRE